MTKTTNHNKRSRVRWLAFGLISVTLVLLWWAGPAVELSLRYDRAGLNHGEWWRLLTGHAVHGSSRHLLLNVAGLALVLELVGEEYTGGQWLWVVAASIAAIDGGFVFLRPELQWYVGLSGVLHGMLAAGAMRGWTTKSSMLAAALSALLIGKLAWEQWRGALPLAGDLPVVVDAHLFGAGGGVCAAAAIMAIMASRRRTADRRRAPQPGNR